jgi:hypothetical protein
MLKRYIGPDDEVRVVVAGTEIGVVKKGEAIAISDDVANTVVWPDELWSDDKPKKDGSK